MLWLTGVKRDELALMQGVEAGDEVKRCTCILVETDCAGTGSIAD